MVPPESIAAPALNTSNFFRERCLQDGDLKLHTCGRKQLQWPPVELVGSSACARPPNPKPSPGSQRLQRALRFACFSWSFWRIRSPIDSPSGEAGKSRATQGTGDFRHMRRHLELPVEAFFFVQLRRAYQYFHVHNRGTHMQSDLTSAPGFQARKSHDVFQSECDKPASPFASSGPAEPWSSPNVQEVPAIPIPPEQFQSLVLRYWLVSCLCVLASKPAGRGSYNRPPVRLVGRAVAAPPPSACNLHSSDGPGQGEHRLNAQFALCLVCGPPMPCPALPALQACGS